MTRPELRTLYHELTSSQFAFVGSGEFSLEDIYSAVKVRFTNLCDDNYLCCQNCAHGHYQPEWRHTVRIALQHMKSTSGPVRHSGRHAYWIFG